MGVFHQPVRIAASLEGPFVDLDALVDTGSLYTWVPSRILERAGLSPTGKRAFQTADGRIIERDVTEAVIEIEGNAIHTVCVLASDGDSVLLGAYTLEGLARAVDPVNRRLVPMPSIPAMAVALR